MNKLIAVLAFLTQLCASLGQQCVPDPPGLVSSWRGENNTLDSITTNNGISQGILSYSNGKVGRCFVFDGTSYVRIPASDSLNVEAGSGLTVEAWIQPTDVSMNRPIVEWRTPGGAGGVQFWTVGPGALWANLEDIGGGDHVFSSAPGLVTTNSFQHVALTYDKTNGVAKIYLSGVVVAQVTNGTYTPRTSLDLYLGYRPWDNIFWSGAIDEVSFYSHALSDAEIYSIYSAGSAGKCGPLTIISQPTNQTATIGDIVSLTVIASGAPPLSYQWLLYGTNISGATNSSLTFTNVQLTNAGVYSVVVGSGGGMFATSSNAILQVLPPNAPSVQINGAPAVGAVTAIDSALVSISGGFQNGFIFYTLDGSQPSFSSTLYTGPFTLTNAAPIQAMSLSENFLDSAFAPAVQLRIKTLQFADLRIR